MKVYYRLLIIVWIISILISLWLVFIVGKSLAGKTIKIDRLSLGLYSLPFHIMMITTLMFMYKIWFKTKSKNKIFEYFKIGFFVLLSGGYFLVLTLFIWLFLLK